MVSLKCAECECIVDLCKTVSMKDCNFCTKESCCCPRIHRKNPENMHNSVLIFLHHTRTLFAAALGIEILCISAAVAGENSAFNLFGYGIQGIIFGYIFGYAAAGLATFIVILGRYSFENSRVDSCCSVLEQQSNKGFLPNLLATFRNFGIGLYKISQLHRQPNLNKILKTSFIILITAESACILTAETIDLIFYRYSILLSIPFALLAGSLTVVAPEAYKKMKYKVRDCSDCC
jgi:hypothetical protein